MIKKIKITLAIFISSLSFYAQVGVGINTTGNTPDQSAMLDVASNNKGMLVPRVALTATNSAAPVASPATSLLVYNTATTGSGTTAVVEGYYYWDGAKWIPFVVGSLGGADDWQTNGNIASTSTFIGSTNSQPFIMRTGNLERMRIQANGDVGIGVPAPVHILDIAEPKTSTTGTTVRIANEPGTNVAYQNGPALVLEIPNVVYGERNTVGIFFNRMRENVEWYVGTEGSSFGAPPAYPSTGNEKFFISRNLKGTNVHSRTRPIFSNNTFFVIDNTGRVGLGMTSPSYKLTLPNNNATTIGQGRAFAWATYSDGRLKTQLKEIEYGLNEIMSLRPLNYNQHNSSILDPNEDRAFHKLIIDSASTSQIGFVAQDLIKIIPEAVNKPEDENTDFWSVDYTRLIPVLVKGIQEQQLIIEDQMLNSKEQNINISLLEKQLQQQQLQIEELKKLIEQK